MLDLTMEQSQLLVTLRCRRDINRNRPGLNSTQTRSYLPSRPAYNETTFYSGHSPLDKYHKSLIAFTCQYSIIKDLASRRLASSDQIHLTAHVSFMWRTR